MAALARVACGCVAAFVVAAHAGDASQSQPMRLGSVVDHEVEGLGLANGARITDVDLTPDGTQVRSFIVDADGQTMECAFAPIQSAADVVRVAPAQMPACSAHDTQPGTLTFSRALKAHVRDRQHEVVGDVKDFYIDPHTGAVTHTIAEFDPAWYEGKGWVALPASSLAAQDGDFIARFRKDEMRAANAPRGSQASAPAAPPPPPGLRRVDVRASTWLGRLVKDEQGTTIGRVADLWMDPAGKAATVASVVSSRGMPAVACRIGPRGITPQDGAFIAHTEVTGSAAPCAASPGALEPGARLQSAKAYLGSRIRSTDGDDVGSVRDIVLHADGGTVHYLLADFTSSWVQDGTLMILPARPLHHGEGGTWIQASLADLQSFPMVGEKRVDDVSAASFAKAVDGYLAKASD